ncbi:MAG: hypothetical protein ACKOZT_02980 [Cyanobium sp.]
MISADELRQLESTLLPALERHHLRLLAHGLRTLQAGAGRRGGPLPDAATMERWAADQPQLAADPGFRLSFLHQLKGLAAQLSAIAAERGRAPLDLQLDDLIAWAERSAQARISPQQPRTPG